jgi:hypothetical protein
MRVIHITHTYDTYNPPPPHTHTSSSAQVVLVPYRKEHVEKYHAWMKDPVRTSLALEAYFSIAAGIVV